MSTNVNTEVLQQLLDRMPGVASSSRVDPTTGKSTWLYVNPRAAEVYGVTEAEMMADPSNAMLRFLPEDLARFHKVIGESLQTLAPMCWLGRIKRRDGEIRWLETQSTVEIEADGSQLWSSQVLDVTERKRAEEALAASEAARARSDALGITLVLAPETVALIGPRSMHGCGAV